jgi:tRNA modification GTPase
MDTFVAQATPVGTSAIALIRVNGPLVGAIVKKLSEGKTHLPRKANYGNYIDESGTVVDSVIWIFFEEGASYTGDAILEIMPHGNPLICKKIIQDLCDSGCRLAEPGEFTQRAFLNKRLNLSQVEGVLETIHAQTDRALFQARKQLSGESGRLIKGIVQELTIMRAEVEAQIDFPEEEIPDEDIQKIKKLLVDLVDQLTAFESTARTKEAIQNGINTLIVGAPNAGKSSLLNYIVGHSRALVSEISGTTRDYIVERAYVGDYLLNLYDTAGITDTPSNEIESLGIKRTLELVDQTDLFILVVDASSQAPTFPSLLLDHLKPENTLLIQNKIDLPKQLDTSNLPKQLRTVEISTLDRKFYEPFKESMVPLLNGLYSNDVSFDTMFNHRQAAFIGNARFELERAHANLQDDYATEIVAFHLIKASEELEKINQHIDNEDVLDQLFQRFCIGK